MDSSTPITFRGTENVSIQTDPEFSSAVYTESGSGIDVSQVGAYVRNTMAPEAPGPPAPSRLWSRFLREVWAVVLWKQEQLLALQDTGSSAPEVNVFAIGTTAAGIVIGGIAGKATESLVKPGQKKTEPMQEEKKQELTADVETQLEVAGGRLRRLNEEPDAPASTGGT